MNRALAPLLAAASLCLSAVAVAAPIPAPTPVPALPDRPSPYVRPPIDIRPAACSLNQRDATCLGFTNTVGSRLTDNYDASLQPITNVRRLPQKPDLLPLGPIIEGDGPIPAPNPNPSPTPAPQQ